ncbi:VOC family protein [Aeromicrobium sp.]|uniref:VOC family protein n=1 Tax=Aeromicrobium sp. TaxID=1871063 RepID=UPI0019B7715D|nr:VOC family protein [Aeromicrobium sp.]MBC7632758.1 VOC family protein [Aeromicrobium sp.]
MPLVTFKNLCLDANDVAAVQGFWAEVLGWTLEELADDEAVLRGDGPGEEFWINCVPEARTVKQRVHLDFRAASLEAFEGLEQLSRAGEFAWTVFADPEGGELCVFTYDDPPSVLLKAVGIDAVDHVAISGWWEGLLGGVLSHDDDGYSSLSDIPGSTLESFDFVPVPEPKTVKNRIHWDVTLTGDATVDDLVAAGATLLRPPDDGQRWTVMADPEGNEFCVFPRT